ncbi:thioesterase family protein [Novosphingobium sp. Chol11]|uniref:thioesterase family protein n=1 Tax=Novosphingobium sp. Chol11 TaxID=1385763 RepID=UPI0025D4F029|nr:thioesterase family protein [Novosphingobium sp. Chol11]
MDTPGITGAPDQAAPDEAAMGLGAMAARLAPLGGRYHLDGAQGWLQGRTMYGGASSFLAYAAARRQFPDLGPLRAGQIGFIAPVGEQLEIEATMLRSGRNISHVETSLYCAGALAHRTIWLFGPARDANGAVEPAAEPALLPPEDAPPLDAQEFVPDFILRMDVRRALPKDPVGAAPRGAVIRRWVRLKERGGLDPLGELIAIGDTLPPGSMRAMERRGPISSINWALTPLGNAPQTRDGWWLLETSSNFMDCGFSSETLRMWNTDGREVMRGLQSVAVFG